MGPESSDADLLEGVRDGEREAWSQLVRRYESRLRAIARSEGLDAAGAQDVAQTVWLRLLNDPFQIHTPEALQWWLRTVARRHAIDVSKQTKKLAGNAMPELADSRPTADDQVMRANDVAMMNELLAALDEKCRELLEAMYGELEPSYADLAARLGRPIGSLGPQRARCIKKLRDLYDGQMYQGAEIRPASGKEVFGR